MKIVVLDGYTLNPGDLSWDGLEALGEFALYDRSAPEEVLERSEGAEILFTNKTVLDRPIIEALPALKYIGVLATGYNVVDVAAAKERGVVVTNIPTYGTQSVAQMAFALLLELIQHVAHHAQTVQDGRWAACDDFCYWDFPMIELADLTMGVVGFGRIGRTTAQIAKAFGMKVIAHDAFVSDSGDPDIEMVGLDALFAQSDVVSLHCPLTDENAAMVNAKRLATMKPTAFLINTSRGPLVNDADLADALDSGRLAGAGLDVLSVEPPLPDNPLLSAKNCFITPHIAWATRSARARLMATAVENIEAFLNGNVQNCVW